ncbi:pantothenate kinase [Acaryochloris marina]|uniref:pantothenate kinase n=1 Tax=Acaryochloris marina TaxID=155978 RepID=UPI0021C308DA|nr:pantothenate kinase [Acaryochloris marina]BDM81026.1 hypothetical protein AM10699_38930 [Acaryochloris marina MBIC10699]
MSPSTEDIKPWIALSIGNSRLHWFYYEGSHLAQTWDTCHIEMSQTRFPATLEEWQAYSPALAHCSSTVNMPELWVISVVPSQTCFWQTYPYSTVITAADIPIQLPYETFGLDRALSIWAAGNLYQWPVFVIDAGTALTYTGALAPTDCLGGAILPGLGLQLRSLSQSTAALPTIALPQDLPSRWSLTTDIAIQSGILHTLVSGIIDFIKAWLEQYPTSQIVLTGGDAETLYRYLLQASKPKAAPKLLDLVILQPQLQGIGLLHLRQQKSDRSLLF